jgi:hypothetical protein
MSGMIGWIVASGLRNRVRTQQKAMDDPRSSRIQKEVAMRPFLSGKRIHSLSGKRPSWSLDKALGRSIITLACREGKGLSRSHRFRWPPYTRDVSASFWLGSRHWFSWLPGVHPHQPVSPHQTRYAGRERFLEFAKTEVLR